MSRPSEDDAEMRELGSKLAEYCRKYMIPLRHIFDILNDQKVTPMMRGKALEYQGFAVLHSQLNASEWSVQKLNLNPQRGTSDQDINVIHRRTGISLKVECKSAVRGSMRSGSRTRICKAPHFKVKCHRSRSNLSKAEASNDRYASDFFDVILTNPLNAIYQGGTVGENLEIIRDEEMVKILEAHYEVSGEEKLLECICQDWRFAIASELDEEGFLPRTPMVLLRNDAKWRPITKVQERLFELVRGRSQRAR